MRFPPLKRSLYFFSPPDLYFQERGLVSTAPSGCRPKLPEVPLSCNLFPSDPFSSVYALVMLYTKVFEFFAFSRGTTGFSLGIFLKLFLLFFDAVSP